MCNLKRAEDQNIYLKIENNKNNDCQKIIKYQMH